jgi:hypothetical protein
VAELKKKCEEQSIELSSISIANSSRKAPVKADIVAASGE